MSQHCWCPGKIVSSVSLVAPGAGNMKRFGIFPRRRPPHAAPRPQRHPNHNIIPTIPLSQLAAELCALSGALLHVSRNNGCTRAGSWKNGKVRKSVNERNAIDEALSTERRQHHEQRDHRDRDHRGRRGTPHRRASVRRHHQHAAVVRARHLGRPPPTPR